LLYGDASQLLKQAIGVLSVGAYAFVVTLILGKLVDLTIKLRVGKIEETVGLDISQHGERAYGRLIQ
jgi:Amt family ammonium transporter